MNARPVSRFSACLTTIAFETRRASRRLIRTRAECNEKMCVELYKYIHIYIYDVYHVCVE